MKFRLLLLCLTMTGLLAAGMNVPVSAQNTDAYGEPYSSKYYREQPSRVGLALMRHPDLPPGKFVIYLTTQNNITGCVKFGNLEHEAIFKQKTLEIIVESYTVDMRNLTKAPHYDCYQGIKNPSAKIVLDRDDIIDRGLEKVVFKTGRRGEEYDIKINDQFVRLMPAQRRASGSPLTKQAAPAPRRFENLSISGVKNSLIHWFYPEGTMILTIPDAKPDQDTAAAMVDFMRKNNLTPIEDILPDFRQPTTTTQVYYVVDKKGTFAHQPQMKSGGMVIGAVEVEDTLYGLHHDYAAGEALTVMARLPGAYD